MTISLKIEIVKIFKLEFELSSDKILKKKESKVEEVTLDKPATSDPAKGK
jgi:hypothetical protein